MLFSDESRFTLQSDNRPVLVWCKPGIRNNPQFVRERRQYERGGMMLWAGICTRGHTDLYFIPNGSLIAQRYLNKILQFVVNCLDRYI